MLMPSNFEKICEVKPYGYLLNLVFLCVFDFICICSVPESQRAEQGDHVLRRDRTVPEDCPVRKEGRMPLHFAFFFYIIA